MTDGDFLRWVASRLTNRYGEHPNTDFVLKLMWMAEQLDKLERLMQPKEPKMSINGHNLSEGQVLTVRVAIETFATQLLEPEFLEKIGPIGRNYLERIAELRIAMRYGPDVKDSIGE